MSEKKYVKVDMSDLLYVGVRKSEKKWVKV